MKQAQIDSFCEAVENGDAPTLRRLLSQDPALAVMVLPDGWPVFLLQSVFPQDAIIDLLIDHGADPNIRNEAGETLLHLTGDPDAIRKLASRGADINAQDHMGLTPMMAHAPYPDTGADAIYTLLALGADPAVAAPDGQTLATRLAADPRLSALRRTLRGAP